MRTLCFNGFGEQVLMGGIVYGRERQLSDNGRGVGCNPGDCAGQDSAGGQDNAVGERGIR